jgi:signal peptidase
MSWAASLLFLLGLTDGWAAAHEPDLFVSKRLTPRNTFTDGIEGPAVDAAGNVFAVNIQPGRSIGKLAVGATTPAIFAVLSARSKANGIRFGREGEMYVADYAGHNVLVFDRGSRIARVYFHSDLFNQPNDLAIAPDGTLYASDPNFKGGGSGRIWKITREADGSVRGMIMNSPRAMSTTNGLDVGADGKTLYVGEATTSELWTYEIDGDSLKGGKLLRKFIGGQLDGLRLDARGRVFVTRNGRGKVAIVAPDGTLVRQIKTLGSGPSNLTFGGPDGKTVFVTQTKGGYIETFQTDYPGREFCLQRISADCQ